MKTASMLLVGAHLLAAQDLSAQTEVQTTGVCSPAFVHSTVTGTISIICGTGDESLARIAEALNTLINRSQLQANQINELINVMNSILSLRPQLERIESSARASQSLGAETLSILRRLIDERRDSSTVIGTIRGLEVGVRERVRRLPEKIDPQDITARISFLALNDTLGCPIGPFGAPNALSQDYRQLISEGDDLSQRHFYRQAIERFSLAARAMPAEVTAHLRMAEALCASRDYAGALSQLDRQPRLGTRRAEFNIARGQLRYRLRQFSEAGEAFRLARSQNPRSPTIAWGEGQSLRRAGDCNRAVTAFSAAIELDPRYVDAYLGRAECRLVLNAPSLAVTDFSTVLTLDEGNVNARERLAHTYRVLASNRTYSTQADYRHFADREERRALELRALAQEQTRRDAPALNCSETTLPNSGAAARCMIQTYYINFDRGQSYINESARLEFGRIVELARSCSKSIVRLSGYADVGEDDFASGLDLATSRSNIVFFALMSLIGQPGLNSITSSAPNEFIIRTGDDRGLIGVFQTVRGYENRPVQAGLRPDERNQVVRVALICEPQQR